MHATSTTELVPLPPPTAHITSNLVMPPEHGGLPVPLQLTTPLHGAPLEHRVIPSPHAAAGTQLAPRQSPCLLAAASSASTLLFTEEAHGEHT